MKEQLLQLLTDLVAINSVCPTLADGPGEAEIGEYVATALRDAGLSPELQTVESGRVNVVATVAGRGGAPPLLLNAHLDTVGTEGMEAPFTLHREDDRLYGRGAYDMKGSVAVMLALAETLADELPPGDVLFTFVADEEDHSIGTEYLVREWLLGLSTQPAGAFVLEPTEEQIGVAHKGFAWFRIGVHGRAAHGSRPDEGVDAILPLAAGLTELSLLQERFAQRDPHPLLGHPSLHASTVAGGTAWSVYPADATLAWERRTLPGETTQTLERELERVLEAVRGFPGGHSVSGELIFERQPHSVDDTSLPVRLLQDVDPEAEVAGMTFWTDAALFGRAGIPSVLYGPRGHGPHAVDEWVSLESLVRVYNVLLRCVSRSSEL